MVRHDQPPYGAIRLRLLTPYEKIAPYRVNYLVLHSKVDGHLL